MLRKMRWRLTGAAMAAFFAVMAVLIAGINFWNYSVTIDRIDRFLDRLAQEEPDGESVKPPEGKMHGKAEIPPEGDRSFWSIPLAPGSAEEKDVLRYFIVELDSDGNVEEIETEYSMAVTQQSVQEYAREVYAKKHDRGFFDSYRYLMRKTEDSVRILFLNAAKERQFIRTLFLISALVGLVSLIIVFVLVVLFSGRAMKPYIKNIELQKRFITDASHELKTPLTSISASADILALDDDGNEWVQNIQKQTVKLSKLIGGLITLSRLDEENPLPDKEVFSLSDTVWETIEPFASVAKARHRKFTYQIEDGLTMRGDQETIRQLLSVLLDNAMKYSDENGMVRLSLVRQHGKIVLQVFNTCSDITQKEAEKLFERFYRPDRSRSGTTGGTGIGLSIAKAAVEAHGGKIAVTCRDNASICFRILF